MFIRSCWGHCPGNYQFLGLETDIYAHCAAGFAHLSLHAGNVIWMEETRTWAVTDLSSAHELGVSVSMSVLGARTRVSPPEVVALAESGSLTVTSRAASDAWVRSPTT